jgi:hypothetical protein
MPQRSDSAIAGRNGTEIEIPRQMRLTSTIQGLLSRALRWAQVDRAIGFAVLGNVVSLILGPLIALLIAIRFSPELQGYYYTFGSLTTVQFAIELGLGQAIIQFASHEWSKLRFDSEGRVVGDPDALSRLLSLSRMSLAWYGGAAVLVVVILIPIGIVFFSRAPSNEIQWLWPWVVLCLGLGANLLLMPIFYLVQGCNQVSQFWFYRMVQQVVYGCSRCLAVLGGAGLWTGGIAGAVGLIWSIMFLKQRYPKFVTSIMSPPMGPRIEWRSTVWPVQWRIGVSWLSTSVTASLFASILFQAQGPVAAGQMGMTATLAVVLLAVSSNWVTTQAPSFGILIARGQFAELDRRFSRAALASFIVACAGAGGIWIFVGLLTLVENPLAYRMLPLLPTGLFLASVVFSSVTANISVYLRAHRREPLAGLYLTTGAVTVVACLFVAGPFGATGMALSYLAVVVFIQTPAAAIIAWRRRSSWHRELIVQ